MSTLYGKNYKLQYVNVPSQKIPRGEQAAEVLVAYDEYDLATLGVALANADVIKFMKMPQGARVLDILFSSPDVGGTSLIQIGYEANGVDIADPDGFLLSADISGQSLVSRGTNIAGLMKQFSVETQVSAVIANAGAATTGVLKLAVYYVVD